jgi:hypothetical protein
MDDSLQSKMEKYFIGYPSQLNTFNRLQEIILGFGPVKIEAMKSQISFGTNYKFAWVWLPQKWKMKQPEGSMVLTIGLDHTIEDPRIKESVNPYPNRWVHHLVINESDQLDGTVIAWLDEAYQFSLRPRGKQ